MPEETNGKANETISSKNSNEKNRKKSKDFFQIEKVSKTTTAILFCKNKK